MKLRHPSWRARLLVDVTLLVLFALVMQRQGAPAWAFTLLAVIATRPSRLDTAADAGAIQSTIRAGFEDVQLVADEIATERSLRLRRVVTGRKS